MSQAANEGTGQEPGTPTGTPAGQEPQGNGNQGQEPGSQGTPSGEFDLSTVQDPAVRAYLEKVQKDAQEARQEAARYRTERNTFQQKATTLQQAQETEQERQQREAQEAKTRMEQLERENRDLKVGTAIQAAATEAKAFNPVLVAGMLDSKVSLDDNGNPTNLKDLLKELRQSDPYLFKRTDANGGEGTGQEAAPAGSMNDVIRNQVAARRGRSTS